MSIRKPMILVFAGPNGSGKSTITQYFDKVGTYTNADDVVEAMEMSNESAAKFVDEKRYKAIDERKDFTFETVLSSSYKLDILRKAKQEGYFIKYIYVLTVNPMVNVARVKARVSSGGHDVERETIIRRYKKSLNNIKYLIKICDILHVYDNTNRPVRIIRKHKEKVSIFPNDMWALEDILRLLDVTQ